MGAKAKSKKRQRAPEAMSPTAEMMARATFALKPVKTDKGQIAGIAYRREPWFETLHNRGDITDDQVRALREYRSTYEETNRSETRCALNRDPGAGSGEGPSIRLAMARQRLDAYEMAMGVLIDTARAIAIHDLPYAQVAMDRYGSREAERLIVGKGKEPPRFEVFLAPRSGRHAGIIRDEFHAALKMLIGVTAPRLRTAA